MRAHKRWKRSLIKSRILEAAAKNDQGMTSITGLLSHHRRQLHLNWTCNSLELPEVDTLCVPKPHSDREMQGGLKKLGRLQKLKKWKGNRWIATDQPEQREEARMQIGFVTHWSPVVVLQVIHTASPQKSWAIFNFATIKWSNAAHPSWQRRVLHTTSYTTSSLQLLHGWQDAACCVITQLAYNNRKLEWSEFKGGETGSRILLDNGRWPHLKGVIHYTMPLYAAQQYHTKPWKADIRWGQKRYCVSSSQRKMKSERAV